MLENRKISRLLVLSFLCVLTFSFAFPVMAQDSAFIRVGHFVSDAPAVDVYLNGELSPIQGLELGDLTVWASVPAGTYSVAIAPAGTSAADAVSELAALELAAGSWTTVSAVGRVADESLLLQPVPEAYGRALPDGQASFSLFHAVAGVNGVDLVRETTVILSTVLFPNPTRGNDGAASVILPAGEGDLSVTPINVATEPVFTLADFAAQADTHYAIFAYGSLPNVQYVVAGTTAAEIGLLTAGGAAAEYSSLARSMPTNTAFVRVAHLASDAPAVDVILNDEVSALTDLAYGTITDWVEVPAGVYDLGVAAAGTGAAAAVGTIEGLLLDVGSWTTVSAIGLFAEGTFKLQAVAEDHTSPIAENNARFTVFHAINAMSGIDFVRDGTVLLSTISFPEEALGNDGAAQIDGSSGTYTFAITAAGRSGTVLADAPGFEAVSGTHYALFAYGTVDATELQIIATSPQDAAALRAE